MTFCIHNSAAGAHLLPGVVAGQREGSPVAFTFGIAHGLEFLIVTASIWERSGGFGERSKCA